jgi:hypothetical protein
MMPGSKIDPAASERMTDLRDGIGCNKLISKTQFAAKAQEDL